MIENFTVPKQIDRASCWAATASAIANNRLGAGSFPQDSLVAKYKNRRSEIGGMNPTVVLREMGLNPSKIGVSDVSKVDMISIIIEKLDLYKPVIAGVKVASGTLYWRPVSKERKDTIDNLRVLGQNVPDPKTGEFKMAHAIVLCGYDSTSEEVFYMDPARGDDVPRAIKYDKLFSGFLYMQLSELGPNARQDLSTTSDGSDSPDDNVDGALNMVLNSVVLV